MSAPLDDRQRLRLLERLAADRDDGGVRDLDHYHGLFPGHESEVEAEWSAWARPAADGTRFEAYRLEQILGQGGQGVVYQAFDTRLQRRVALKVLNAPVLASGPDDVPRLLAREIEALARIEDPRIAEVYEAGVADGRAFLAMRLVKGPSLRQEIGRWQHQGGPALRERLQLGLEIVEAVAAAHDRGVVHRDIKPSNVLLERANGDRWRPFLIDFGLARAIDTDLTGAGGRTRTGDQIGTPTYMSPERLQGLGHDDPRADVWALGVLLYELVTCEPPFTGTTFETVARRIERDHVPRVRVDGFVRRRDLEALLQRSLEKTRTRRYADARAMANDLAALLDGRAITARPVGPVGRLLRWGHRNPAIATILGLLLAIAGGASWTAWRLERSQQLERDAKQRATASLARAEADRAHLQIASDAPGRLRGALEHLQRAAAAGAAFSSATRSDLVRALTGTDLTVRETVAIGGLGIVKVDATGTIAAARCVSPSSRRPELTLHDLAGPDAGAPLLPPPLPNVCTLLAACRDRLAIAQPDGAHLVRLSRGGEQPTPSRRIEALPATGASGRVAHDFAAFDATGRSVVVAAGRAWTLYRTEDGTALANGTCGVALGQLANFSADGRWFVVRHDPRTVFVLDEARDPIRLSFDHPVVQAAPAVEDRATLVILQATPAGLELGVWQAPGDGDARPRYRRLTSVSGAGSPTPKIAIHGRWVAAATTSELVVVDRLQQRVRARCHTDGGHAIESLVFRGGGDRLLDLELFVHQRSAPLRRLGFAQAVDWLRPAEAGTMPFDPERGRLHLEQHDVGASDGRPMLPTWSVGFEIGENLQLGSDGAPFVPPGARLSSDVVTAAGRRIGAAMLGLVRRHAIENHVLVWRQGDARPFYRFETGTEPGRGAIALSGDGRLLAAMLADGRLQLHDLVVGCLWFEVPVDVEGIGRATRELAFGDDGLLWLRASGSAWRFDLPRLMRELQRRGAGLTSAGAGRTR